MHMLHMPDRLTQAAKSVKTFDIFLCVNLQNNCSGMLATSGVRQVEIHRTLNYWIPCTNTGHQPICIELR